MDGVNFVFQKFTALRILFIEPQNGIAAITLIPIRIMMRQKLRLAAGPFLIIRYIRLVDMEAANGHVFLMKFLGKPFHAPLVDLVQQLVNNLQCEYGMGIIRQHLYFGVGIGGIFDMGILIAEPAQKGVAIRFNGGVILFHIRDFAEWGEKGAL